ncbi:MAG: hypothetical protein MZV64_04155 [Ignavibacteriales bacterium]|nr:hypothetical protein [Ignavibacteriales bacterium]
MTALRATWEGPSTWSLIFNAPPPILPQAAARHWSPVTCSSRWNRGKGVTCRLPIRHGSIRRSNSPDSLQS